MADNYLSRVGKAVARGVPQMATGFVDLAGLPFTMTGLLKPEQVFGSTAYLTDKGLLPQPQTGLLGETIELGSSMLNPSNAVNAGLLGLGGIIKNPVTQQKALQAFGRTRDPQQAFYLLDDGSLLSGENVLNIPKDLKMLEHVEAPIRSDVMLNENVSEDYIGSLINKFIDDTGAARYYNRPDYGGIQLVNSNKPSDAQIRAMANQFKNKELAIDINDINTGDVYKDKVFQNPTYEEIKKFIDESYK